MILTAIICFVNNFAGANHPVSVTEAVVYVQREKISVVINVFVEDLYLFHNLSPDAQNRIPANEILNVRPLHQKFLLERFQLRDADGELLQGKPIGIDEFEMPPEGIALEDLMNYSYGFRFEYPLSKPLEFLTVTHKLVDETAGIPAEMHLRVKQEGSETPYYAILQPGVPVTIRFSWENPPLSPDASEEEWEKWIQQQREDLLGITSYSSVYSFIYIDDAEIRHEILVPLATLEPSVLIPRQDEVFLEVEEQPEAAEHISAYFLSGNPVIVDGQRIRGEVRRVDFYGVDFRDFAQQAPKRRVTFASGRVGIILAYPLRQPPKRVEITWDRFNRYIHQVRSIIYAYDKTETFVFTRYGSEQTYRWENHGPVTSLEIPLVEARLPEPRRWVVPMATVICLMFMPLAAGVLYRFGAGRGLRLAAVIVCAIAAIALWPYGHVRVRDPWSALPALSDAETAHIYRQLHEHVYQAFQARGEAQIYDALARSVDGPLLRELYLQVQKGLIMQEQGGAVSKIRRVEIVDWQRLPALPPWAAQWSKEPAFAGRCRWQVEGTVEHWGHIHARTNQYEALVVVAVRDQAWKIVGLELLQEERVRFETKLRGL